MNIHDFDPQRESVEREILGAILFPHTGTRVITVHGAAKTIEQVFVAPGAGLCRQQRRSLLGRTVSVAVRGEIYFGRPAPSVADFDEPTLRWALGKSNEIAIWSAPYPDNSKELAAWIFGRINAGSTFNTTIETTPSRAAGWVAAVDRWKGPNSEVRVFGPEVVQ